jgi:hypothetical protein
LARGDIRPRAIRRRALFGIAQRQIERGPGDQQEIAAQRDIGQFLPALVLVDAWLISCAAVAGVAGSRVMICTPGAVISVVPSA